MLGHMEGFLFVVIVGGLALAGMAIFARHVARRNPVSKRAMRATRLSGDGGGWLYTFGWPKRRNIASKNDPDDL